MAKRPKSESATASVLTCIPKRLPEHLQVAAAHEASQINPQNNAPIRRLAGQLKGYAPTPLHIALVTSRYWGPGGVKLSVSFLDGTTTALRNRILSHMNAWSQPAKLGAAFANVQFLETYGIGDVRIAFEGGANGGYWSYLGTDIRSIDLDQQTMNLEAFTMNTPEGEFHRVVRHETGHTLGFPHEHLRASLVAKIDVNKAIKYFGDTQGWSPDEVRAQVLTPLEKSSIMGTLRADQRSIMCYEIPGEITKSGKPIIGGNDIDAQDYAFASEIYPSSTAPHEEKRESRGRNRNDFELDDAAVIEIAAGLTRVILRRPHGPVGSALRDALLVRATQRGVSVLQRLVALIGNVGIVVTQNTKWKTDLGHSDDSLDLFCREQVSDEFGKPFDGSDAGTTVGDLVKSINRALGA